MVALSHESLGSPRRSSVRSRWNKWVVLVMLWSACTSARANTVVASPRTPSALSPSEKRSCARRFTTPLYRDLFEDLAHVSRVEPVWPDHRAGTHDLVLESVDEGSPEEASGGSCVAHWSGSQIIAVARSPQRIENGLGLFGFLIANLADSEPAARMGFLAGGVPTPVLDSLRAAHTRAALVWSGDERSLAAAGLANNAAQRRRIVRYLVLHETAHVEQLFGPVFDSGWPTARPSWMVQAEEELLIDRCLADESAKRERSTLADAIAAIERRDAVTASAEFRAFAIARAHRYQRLREVIVPASNGPPMPCWIAESVWEMDEGGADFISMVSLQEASLALPFGDTLADYVREDKINEPYYATGMGQLYLLRAIAADAEARFRAMAAATTPQEGLWCQVVEHLGIDFGPCASAVAAAGSDEPAPKSQAWAHE